MTDFNYDNRYFRGTVNYDDGDLTYDTLFHYRQQGSVVWGTFEGGSIVFGTLLARVEADGRLDMVWQYLNKAGEFHSGTCLSIPELLPDGRYRLHESWQVADGHGTSGSSVIEEVRP